MAPRSLFASTRHPKQRSGDNQGEISTSCGPYFQHWRQSRSNTSNRRLHPASNPIKAIEFGEQRPVRCIIDQLVSTICTGPPHSGECAIVAAYLQGYF
jgi:hypothetical protein